MANGFTAERIKEARKAKGLTLTDTAKEVGCTEAMLSFIETGDKVPSVAILKRLAKVFDVSADWLLGLVD